DLLFIDEPDDGVAECLCPHKVTEIARLRPRWRLRPFVARRRDRVHGVGGAITLHEFLPDASAECRPRNKDHRNGSVAHLVHAAQLTKRRCGSVGWMFEVVDGWISRTGL